MLVLDKCVYTLVMGKEKNDAEVEPHWGGNGLSDLFVSFFLLDPSQTSLIAFFVIFWKPHPALLNMSFGRVHYEHGPGALFGKHGFRQARSVDELFSWWDQVDQSLQKKDESRERLDLTLA